MQTYLKKWKNAARFSTPCHHAQDKEGAALHELLSLLLEFGHPDQLHPARAQRQPEDNLSVANPKLIQTKYTHKVRCVYPGAYILHINYRILQIYIYIYIYIYVSHVFTISIGFVWTWSNVNPGLINHGLLIRGYSRNSNNLILKWCPPTETAVWGLLIQGWQQLHPKFTAWCHVSY